MSNTIKTYPANIAGNTTEIAAGQHVARLSVEHANLAPEASRGTVDLMIWGEPNMMSDGCDLVLEGLTIREADIMLSGLIEALTAQRAALRALLR